MSVTKVIRQNIETNQTDDIDQVKERTILVPAFNLPSSEFLSIEARKVLQRYEILDKELDQKLVLTCPPIDSAEIDDIPLIRKRRAEIFYASPHYTSLTSRYDVLIETESIGGVYTEVFQPSEGVSSQNQEYVLINLHGGGFTGGSRVCSHVESIPISSTGRFKVISIDYRMAPEYQFPAASKDVVDVYTALLQDYKPENIGIYGCSAGGILTAQTIACLQQEGLPLPGAIGMLCAAAYYWNEGDSGYFSEAIVRDPHETPQDIEYFKDVDNNDPLVFPGRSSDILAKFPPSLLITSSRDEALSSVIHTHGQLIKRGVTANLHVWDGLEHAFLYNPDLPESREVYSVIVSHFNKHLGMPGDN